MPSMQRDRPPYRADHVGSLLRPAALAAAREEWRAGKRTQADLKSLEDKCIRAAIAMQEGVGLKGVTDGEFRRDYWHLDFMWGFDGVEPSEETYSAPFSNETPFIAPAARIAGRIRFPAGGIMREAFDFLKAETHATAKITIPAPTTFRNRFFRDLVSRDAYPDLDGIWDDLGRAYNDAVKDFAALGCRYLQLDDVNSAVLCSEQMRAHYRSQGDDPDAILDRYIAALNAATAGRPADMAVTTHHCRGNYRSQHLTSGGYEAVAEKLLGQVDVDGFFMEYDDERSGGFEPLRFVPRDKMVVLGLVTSKVAALESKDALKRRIDEATRYIELDQLCLSPQCGFASTREGNALTEDEQRAKLALVVEVASEVWGGA